MIFTVQPIKCCVSSRHCHGSEVPMTARLAALRVEGVHEVVLHSPPLVRDVEEPNVMHEKVAAIIKE